MSNMTGTDQAQVSDTDLAERVQKAIAKVYSLHVWSELISVTVQDGAVNLAGHVRTSALKQRLDTAVWSLQGVLVVKNDLIVDTELERAVAQALAADARTAGGFPGILVGSAFGEVFLKGSVNSQDVKKAAEQIARGVPNVRSVVNELSAPEPPKPAAPAKPAPAKPAPKLAVKEEEGDDDNEA